jgi:Zn-dependent protease
MSLFYMLLYGTTGSVLFGALAAFNALLNLFNLLPVLPLDGGQLLKQISFSMSRYRSLASCLLVTVLGCVFSFSNGLPLLGILMLIGCTEIIVAWKKRCNSDLLSMDYNGQGITSLCYIVIVLCYIAILWFFAGMGDDILGLPLKILYS